MSRPNETPLLDEHRHALVDRLAAADGLLAGFDFDGTLAPITTDPDAASADPGTAAALAALSDGDRVRAVVVSGRALSDLRTRVDAPACAGNHGLELHVDGETNVVPAAEDARGAVAAAADRLGATLAEVDGALIEEKGVSATVHYRAADDDAVPGVERVVRHVAADYDALEVTGGKAILELRPAVDWDKGDALDRLTERLVPDDEDWTRLYVGDDRTDEDAFAALSADDFGVKVGEGDTLADYRVADPAAVTALLEWLADHGHAALERGRTDVSTDRLRRD